jgi:hypothetical protein
MQYTQRNPLPLRGPAFESVTATMETVFDWQYALEKQNLLNLYEKGKTLAWNANDLDWSIDVNIERMVKQRVANGMSALMNGLLNPPRPLGDEEVVEFQLNMNAFMLSQFLHGEQGALRATAKIVQSVPWEEAKFYAANQVADEARHVEVYHRYLTEKLGVSYEIHPSLGALLADIMTDTRWDVTYLGMQIMVEGLALAAFGFMQQMTKEPLLKKLLRYVMSDEARHVAFGVLSLQEIYGQMTGAEIRERQEFAFEAALRMRDRFLRQEVWDRLGVDNKQMVPFLLAIPEELKIFQQFLFTKIVPNCKKLGLLDAGDGWLRQRFTEIGVIQFEDWVDTGEEYALLDEVAKDREAEAAA